MKHPEKRFRKKFRMDVCVCGKLKVLYFRNYSADRAKVSCILKADAALSLILFSLKFIH